MHALSRVREGPEIAERVVIQEFALEALQGANTLSTLGGTLGAIFPFFDRLFDRIGFKQGGAGRGRPPGVG